MKIIQKLRKLFWKWIEKKFIEKYEELLWWDHDITGCRYLTDEIIITIERREENEC